jgi:hypothetical protein
MNVQETTVTTTDLGIRELTATELEYVSGGVTVCEWLVDFALTFKTRAILLDGCVANWG